MDELLKLLGGASDSNSLMSLLGGDQTNSLMDLNGLDLAKLRKLMMMQQMMQSQQQKPLGNMGLDPTKYPALQAGQQQVQQQMNPLMMLMKAAQFNQLQA